MAESPEYPGAPRWVKVFGIIALALLLLFLIVHLSGHGLGNHAPFGGHTTPQSGR